MESHGEPLDPKDSAIRSYFEQFVSDPPERFVTLINPTPDILYTEMRRGSVHAVYTPHRRPHKWESEQERKEWFATHANQLEHWWDEPQLDDH